ADGSAIRCHPVPSTRGVGVLAWRDTRQVVVSLAGGTTIAILDVDTWDLTTVLQEGIQFFQVSPDGRWALCRCSRLRYSPLGWFIFPIDQPSEFRPLRVSGSDSSAVRFTWRWRATQYVDTLRIELGVGNPVAGVPYKLVPVGIDSRGSRVPIG